MVAVSSWNIAPYDQGKNFRVNLRVHLPGQQDPMELQPLHFVGDRRRQRAIQVILGFPIAGPGDWRFELLLDGNPCAHHTITAELHETQPSANPQANGENLSNEMT
jgi:hypothetical protein